MRDRTKRLFALELVAMLNEMPLEKVHVKDLCERCGERRQLFYYHFQDKYALVAWMYDQEYNEAAKEIEGQGYHALVEKMLEKLWEDRGFYRKAFADKSQNSIEWHIHDENLRTAEAMLKKHLGVKGLSDEQRHAILFHSFGSVGTAIEWLRGNLHATPSQLADWHVERMPAFLRRAYEAEIQERTQN